MTLIPPIIWKRLHDVAIDYVIGFNQFKDFAYKQLLNNYYKQLLVDGKYNHKNFYSPARLNNSEVHLRLKTQKVKFCGTIITKSGGSFNDIYHYIDYNVGITLNQQKHS